MKMLYLIVFVLNIFYFQVNAQEESVTYESSYAVEGNDYLEKTRERWGKFEKEMKWFLAYSDPLAGEKLSATKISPEKQQQLVQYEALVQHLTKAQDSFLELRNAIYDSISFSYYDAQSTHTFMIQANSLLTLSDWYTNFIEQTFFPEGWNELYRNNLDRNYLPISSKKNSKQIKKSLKEKLDE